MPNRSVSTNTAGWLPLAAAILLLSALPAAAQEPTGIQKFFGALGLLSLPEESINYRERAPLVVPPSPALIQPRGADDIARNNPDWPVDHDRRSRKADEEAEKKSDEEFYSGRALTPAEINRGRISRQEAARRPQPETAGSEYAAGRERHSPDQLGFKGWGKKKEETVVFTGEPDRVLLTDPPPGLRTPSSNAPYGIVTTKVKPKKLTIDDRGTDPGNRP